MPFSYDGIWFVHMYTSIYQNIAFLLLLLFVLFFSSTHKSIWSPNTDLLWSSGQDEDIQNSVFSVVISTGKTPFLGLRRQLPEWAPFSPLFTWGNTGQVLILLAVFFKRLHMNVQPLFHCTDQQSSSLTVTAFHQALIGQYGFWVRVLSPLVSLACSWQCFCCFYNYICTEIYSKKRLCGQDFFFLNKGVNKCVCVYTDPWQIDTCHSKPHNRTHTHTSNHSGTDRKRAHLLNIRRERQNWTHCDW